MDSPQAVVELMGKELSQYDREVFCILNMKNNGQVINMNLVSVGTVSYTHLDVYKRQGIMAEEQVLMTMEDWEEQFEWLLRLS